jgi:hypothetical protein
MKIIFCFSITHKPLNKFKKLPSAKGQIYILQGILLVSL